MSSASSSSSSSSNAAPKHARSPSPTPTEQPPTKRRKNNAGDAKTPRRSERDRERTTREVMHAIEVPAVMRLLYTPLPARLLEAIHLHFLDPKATWFAGERKTFQLFGTKTARRDQEAVHPRDVQYLRPYKYNGYVPMTRMENDLLRELRETMSTIVRDELAHRCPSAFAGFNYCLVNRYKNGDDYIGMHSDAELTLVPGMPIACLSLGCSRIFRMDSKDGLYRIDSVLTHGSVVIMMPGTQVGWKHGLPRDRDCFGPNSERISLTYRCVIAKPTPTPA